MLDFVLSVALILFLGFVASYLQDDQTPPPRYGA